jgi:hypothetical protein
MIWENAGAATVPPKMALLGSSSTTMEAIRGSFAGAYPTNDATYRYGGCSYGGLRAVPVLPATR